MKLSVSDDSDDAGAERDNAGDQSPDVNHVHAKSQADQQKEEAFCNSVVAGQVGSLPTGPAGELRTLEDASYTMWQVQDQQTNDGGNATLSA